MLPAIAPRRRWPRLVPAVPIALLLLLCAIALLAPWIAPYPPLQGSLGDKLLPPAWLAGGNWSHPLGTDLLGRDILSRIFYGARTSLAVAAIAVILAGSMGTVLGLVAGYFGGAVDVADHAAHRRRTVAAADPRRDRARRRAGHELRQRHPRHRAAAVAALRAADPRRDAGAARARLRGAGARSRTAPHTRIIMRHILPNVDADAARAGHAAGRLRRAARIDAELSRRRHPAVHAGVGPDDRRRPHRDRDRVVGRRCGPASRSCCSCCPPTCSATGCAIASTRC